VTTSDPTGEQQVTIRCPACDQMYQPLPPLRGETRTCSWCGHEVALADLVRGRGDGIYGVKPAELPKSWNGKLILVYPDGTQSDMDLDGTIVRPGEPVPWNESFVLERFDSTDRPVADGKFGLVGILRSTQ
jgi:hypothetical protein